MGMTLVEKIIANHSKYEVVKPGENVDIEIDARVDKFIVPPYRASTLVLVHEFIEKLMFVVNQDVGNT